MTPPRGWLPVMGSVRGPVRGSFVGSVAGSVVGPIAGMLIGGGIIALLIYSLGPEDVLSAVLSARPDLLALAALVYTATLLIVAFRWRRILLRMGSDIPLLRAYRAFAGGVLLSDVTPARIGDFSRPLMVRDLVELKRGFASVAVDRYSDVLTTSALGLSGLVLISGSWRMHALLASSFIIAILIGAPAIWKGRRRILLRLQRSRFALLRSAQGLVEPLEGLDKTSGLLASSVALTASAWITHALRVSLIASAFGETAPIQNLILILPLVSVLSLIPITPAGLGLVEGGLTAALMGLGVPASSGISIALVDRAITVFIHALIGGREAGRMTGRMRENGREN